MLVGSLNHIASGHRCLAGESESLRGHKPESPVYMITSSALLIADCSGPKAGLFLAYHNIKRDRHDAEMLWNNYVH